MAITKSTMWSMSLTTMGTFIGAIWMASIFVQDKVGMIDVNASGIMKLEVRDTQETIRRLKSERREVEAEKRAEPENPYIQRDLDALNDDIEYYEEILECLRIGGQECQ